MTDKEIQAQESLLAIAHSIVGERINERLPGANDDAQAEYNEERLIAAAREFADASRERILATGSDYDRQVLRGPQINGDRC